MELFFKLVIGHVIADYALQNDTMAVHKNRNSKSELFKTAGFPAWYYWLTAHSIIHGAAVYLVTGSMIFALVEIFLHWLIDFGKCDGSYGIHVDQTLHILCKAGYVYFILY
ncbi:MAG: DUF3307 domain-containing protein [Calditrichaeota bacterium]|nr:DUF3307 domain-containing protein [Calditrichota bacterium]